MITEFDDIRPYNDSEISDAMHRIVRDPAFDIISNFLYPNVSSEYLREKFLTFNTVNSFQVNFSDSVIQNIVKKSSSGLSYSGIEHLSSSKRYLFLSNHRDVLLDAAILQIILAVNKHETSEITFGDNLMSSELIIDIGKSNKMFKLIRGGTPKNIFINSLHTSKYIRFAINEKLQSIWIAQRNGRTKDGNDQTQQGVLKMLGMSGGNDFVKNFDELNIVPTVISFEYDPCDILKTREIYITRKQTYVKAKGEDFKSLITGITQFKGNIHMAFEPQISLGELSKIGALPKNERMPNLAMLFDSKVYSNYRLWKTNYIAYDILNGDHFNSTYSASERDDFVKYMNKMVSKIEGDKDELESIFLGIYSNPVVNYIKVSGTGIQKITNKIVQFEFNNITI